MGLFIKDRSSIASKGVHVLGGVIDPDYTGYINVVLINLTREDVIIPEGVAIAQAVPIKSTEVVLMEVNELMDRKRGDKGFGSTNEVKI